MWLLRFEEHIGSTWSMIPLPATSGSIRVKPRQSCWLRTSTPTRCSSTSGVDERLLPLRGISVIGTLGVVAGARRAGVLERAAPVVAELRADGFWLADALVEEFLRGLGEAP